MDQLPEIRTDDFLQFLLQHGYSESGNDQRYIHLEKDCLFAQPSRIGSNYITITNREKIGGKALESVLKQAAIQIETFIDNLRSTIALEVDKSIVAYIDILGFSKKIQDASRNPDELNRFLKHFYNTNKTAFNRINDFTSRQKQFDIFKSSHVRYFSDNLVLIQECVSTDHEESEIGRVLIEIAHYQSELAINDFFHVGQ